MAFAEQAAVLLIAIAVDRVVGDPAWLWRRLPHPVAVAGRGIGLLDSILNRPTLPAAMRRALGVVAVGGLLTVGAAAAWLGAWICGPSPAGLAAQGLVAATLIAHKSLAQHVAAVAAPLEAGDLGAARAAVAMIVGRDVSALDEAGAARAAVESAAENFSDGVVAPAFWLGLLGLPGLVVYKIANTADSMIGHRSERHRDFGWAAARLDDLLNLIPARLSALCLAVGAAILRLNCWQALACAWRDAAQHRSPNAGWPEAAAAGALGVALGGPRRYGDLAVDGAWLNADGRRNASAGDIRRALQLIDAAWVALTLVPLLTIAFALLR